MSTKRTERPTRCGECVHWVKSPSVDNSSSWGSIHACCCSVTANKWWSYYDGDEEVFMTVHTHINSMYILVTFIYTLVYGYDDCLISIPVQLCKACVCVRGGGDWDLLCRRIIDWVLGASVLWPCGSRAQLLVATPRGRACQSRRGGTDGRRPTSEGALLDWFVTGCAVLCLALAKPCVVCASLFQSTLQVQFQFHCFEC